ncbi:hypothetical protein [Rhodovulum sulfidophilum]|uniref:hypothetical protein n=1 Tax=Rhodovulum sulfidophilum TaxID=35806 RepID=UPI0009522B2C|nr:hypothetical protein [Rhodovulum sulfidophilum]OLS50605.1 hypothetical protein BV392_00365 [Rhodovulum sulfidophilum]
MDEQTVFAVKALVVGARAAQARGLGLPCGSPWQGRPAQQPGRSEDLRSRSDALCIADKTRSQIKRKLGLRGMTDLIHLAIATGPSTGSMGAKSRGSAQRPDDARAIRMIAPMTVHRRGAGVAGSVGQRLSSRGRSARHPGDVRDEIRPGHGRVGGARGPMREGR